MLSAATEMRSILYSPLTLTLFLHPSCAHCYAPRSFSLSLSRRPSLVRFYLARASTRSTLRGFSPFPFSLRVSFIPSYSHFHRRLFLFLSPLSFAVRPYLPFSLRRCSRFPSLSLSSFPLHFHPTSLLHYHHGLTISPFLSASSSLLAFSPCPSSYLSLATHFIAAPPRPSRDVTIVGRHLAIRQPRSSVIVPLYSRIPARLFRPSGRIPARISGKDSPASRVLLATSEFAGTQINEITRGFRPYPLWHPPRASLLPDRRFLCQRGCRYGARDNRPTKIAVNTRWIFGEVEFRCKITEKWKTKFIFDQWLNCKFYW